MQQPIITSDTPKRRARRTYSKEFKAQLVTEYAPGKKSIAQISIEHQINANLLHKWVVLAKEGNYAPAMVPVAVPQVAKTNLASVEICTRGCAINFFNDWEPDKVAALIKLIS